MKKYVTIYLVIIIIVFIGCSSELNFSAPIEGIKNNNISLECSELVDDSSDVGHECSAKITENTTIKNIDGDLIKPEALEVGQKIELTLNKSLFERLPNQSEAKEIKIIENENRVYQNTN